MLERIQKTLLIVLLFLVPVFFLPITQEFFITHKLYLLILVSLVICSIGIVRFMASKQISFVSTPFSKVVVLFLLTRALSIIFSSPNRIQSLISIPTGFAMFAALTVFYFVLVNFSHRSENKNVPVFSIFNYSGLILGLLSIIFFFEPLKNASLPPYLQFLSAPSFSPLGAPLDVLLFFGFLAVYNLASIITPKYTHEPHEYGQSPNKILPFIVLVVSVISIGLMLFTNNKAVQEKRLLIQLAPADATWDAAVDTLKNSKTAVFGVSPDNFISIFTRVKPRSYNQSPYWLINFTQGRSALLQIWIETGLLGFFSFLLLALYIIRESRWLYEKKDSYSLIYILSGLYLGAVLILVPSSFIVWFLFYCYLAVLSGHDRTKQSYPVVFMPLYIGVVALGVILVAGSLYLSGRAYGAEYYFKKSLDAVATNKAQPVYDNQKKAIQLNPYNESYHLRLSQISLLLANNTAQKETITDQDRQSIAQLIQQAIQEGKIALKLNPQKPAHWANLALIYRNTINIAKGSESWAVAAYQGAILRDPANPVLHFSLGGVYYGIKNYDEAAKAFSQTVLLKQDWPNAHYNLAWAFFQNKEYNNAVLAMQNVLRLVAKDTEDYKLAQKNLEEFNKKLKQPTEATQEGELKLEKPPETKLSPPVQLPKDAAPDFLSPSPSPSPSIQPQITPITPSIIPTGSAKITP